jgi:hypothetical protein
MFLLFYVSMFSFVLDSIDTYTDYILAGYPKILNVNRTAPTNVANCLYYSIDPHCTNGIQWHQIKE